MPAIGAECAVCRKANHPGVTQCVFCGSPIDAALGAPRTGLEGGEEASGVEPRSARPRWSESPHAEAPTLGHATVAGAPVVIGARHPSDPPAPSRRAIVSDPDSDEMLAAPVADPLIGVVVAERYRIVEPLGRGGMGIVYRVEHTRIGKLLAMKLLTGELSRNPEVVRRFKQEALTVSKLSSPNTVQVFDFGAAEGLTYLVMELVAGEDLARLLRAHGPMPFSRLGKIVIQVCSSLAEAHQKGIVHRDVKPENVMLLRARDGTDVAKVLDFGLAKLREGADLNDVTSQGAIVGTPYFMAPEQIRGEPVDNRSDIYALGALMYRALTGHYPFNGPTPMAVFTKHLTEPPVPPADRAPELGIPPGVSAIVMKALEKSPADRFQKVEDLQAALVEEVRAAGTTSVEDLLDSGQLHRLAKVAAEADQKGPAPAAEIATRDEFERYERKLRRQRWGAFFSLAFVLAGAVFGGVKFFLHERAELKKGREIEPNDTAAQATPLPFDSSATAYLGKRLDPAHGDRDFYAVDVPASSPVNARGLRPAEPGSAPEPPGAPALVKLKVSALPNFAMCTLLYRQGFDTALGQYCVGRVGRELSIPALRLEPGRYFVAVLQDLDPYGGTAPFIHENISDPYVISIGAASPASGDEIEPNDQVNFANPITPGNTARGTIGWTRDEDFYCVPAGTPGNIRWRARDVVRDAGTVLEVTPMRGTLEGAPVRVHAGVGRPPTATDVLSPWQSGVIAGQEGTPRCLRVRLTNDPWSGGSAVVVPTGGNEVYTIEVEAAP
jgi:serine/threonine-protein kinase